MKNGIVAQDDVVVTDEMIGNWESVLERDEWPSGWKNVGEIIEGKLPTMTETATLSIKIPASMKRAIDAQAKNEGKTVSEYVRCLLVDSLMEMA